MSSEVCPFCGKTYKRLKSHLPHCKAAASSKTPPSKHNVAASQVSSSSQLAADLSDPTSEEKKSTQTPVASRPQSKKSKKVPVVSMNASPSSQTVSQSSVLPSSSTKKKKQKLSEQIKTANLAASTSVISPSQSQSLDVSEPKKKSLRALIEAAKSKQVSAASVEGSKSASEDLPIGANTPVADPVNSRTNIHTEWKNDLDKDQMKDNSNPDFLSTDSKPKGGRKTKTQKAAQTVPPTKDTSLDANVKETTERLRLRDDFFLEDKEEAADYSENKMFSNSGSGHQTRITLQDVKTTLARANSTRQTNRPSILSQIQTADDLKSRIRNQESCLITDKTMSEQLHGASPQQTELQSVKRKSLKSQQAALIPLQQKGSPQSGMTSPEAFVLPGCVSQRNQATPPPYTVSINESLKVGPHKTPGLLTISPSLVQFSSPHPLRYTPQTLSARVETLRADAGSQLEVWRQNTADNGAKERSLGQVRLRELPEWLACRTPGHPRDVVEMVQRGWQWYYNRYINVKKGGVSGVGMLLAGYCVLSYIWSYPHIKRDRWRKHH
ncbi:uncharacterized protein C17orf80 homolog [Notolabrus celidotus]|uniref:uncharacterized protein C17orf80 homolog n=1 Tax=Notolabrus celidotus TaxID=1203425 RepID=UPI00149006E2|nr:uncharacterized protein C17orf80 homolog [Notolabrus celidotus]XP_034564056.1 uncharacterized protein C17orf80 homolog [Notolabrus celidotus]